MLKTVLACALLSPFALVGAEPELQDSEMLHRESASQTWTP